MRLLVVWLILGLLVLVVQLRFRHNLNQLWCDGCEVIQATRLWKPIDRTSYYFSFEHQGNKISCLFAEPSCAALRETQIGDTVTFSGEVELEPQQSWADQRSLQGVKITQLSLQTDLRPWQLWWWLRHIDNLRLRVIGMYQVTFTEPYAGLLAGIVMGERAQISDSLYESLIATGTMHVIAASGFNISIVTWVSLSLLTLVLPRRAALLVSAVLVAGYAILAGANPAIIRAALMGWLAYVAQLVGREYVASWSIVVAASVMLLIWPWMLYSLSFALSTAATLGMIWGVKPTQSLLAKLTRRDVSQGKTAHQKRNLIEGIVYSDLSTTLAATLATLPITAVVFGRISVVSPLVNSLVLWLIPPLMALGSMVAVVGLVWQPLALLVGMLAQPPLYVFIKTIYAAALIPGASIEVESIGWWWGIGYWCLLASWWLPKHPHNHSQHT